jgi:hypothetical protein
MKADASTENTLAGMQHFLKLSYKNRTGMCTSVALKFITTATNVIAELCVFQK